MAAASCRMTAEDEDVTTVRFLGVLRRPGMTGEEGGRCPGPLLGKSDSRCDASAWPVLRLLPVLSWEEVEAVLPWEGAGEAPEVVV